MNTSLLLSTILMLKKSFLKDYLFKIMTNLNKLNVKNHFNNDPMQINEDIIADIHIFLENMDEWMRIYNSTMRLTMKKELIQNLIEIREMFKTKININN